MKMPTADSGIVRRDSMPAAMPSWSAAISVELVLSSGVRRIPPARPNCDEEEGGSGAEDQFGILLDEAGGAVHRPHHEGANDGAFTQAAAHQRENRQPEQEFKIGAKHVFQPARLAGDVVGAEPFDVRGGGAGGQGINHKCGGSRCCNGQQPTQTHHFHSL